MEKSKTIRKRIAKGFIAFAFLGWFIGYACCDRFGISNVDLFRASLNTAMAFVILIVTLKERYALMYEADNYDVFVESDKLLPAFSMAFVPFAGTISDLSRTDFKDQSFTLFFIVMLLLSVTEYLVFLMLTSKGFIKSLINTNSCGVAVFLFLSVASSKHGGPELLKFLNQLFHFY